MNRIVLYGLTGFFSVVGICLFNSPKEAQAFHGWNIYGGWSCQGASSCGGGLRCYSTHGCYGCQGCCASTHNCCASRCYSSCYSQQPCYGCCGGCAGQGCYSGCYGCYGYYQQQPPTYVVPVEPVPAANTPASPQTGKTTLQAVPLTESELSYLTDENLITISSGSTSRVVDAYIHEPR